jgi:hypothetical protein
MFIYKIENKINHKIYVGKTAEENINIRFIKHIKRSKYHMKLLKLKPIKI